MILAGAKIIPSEARDPFLIPNKNSLLGSFIYSFCGIGFTPCRKKHYREKG